MQFNSLAFTLFFPVTFLVYWLVLKKRLKAQNLFLLLASWVFYAWWDWRFLALLVSLSTANFLIALQIEKRRDFVKRKKRWVILGLILNLGVLVFFKYLNFFIDSFVELISLIGYNIPKTSLRVILPLGISFYVFISLSYLLDISRGSLKASRNLSEILLALNFFPIILAGPIQRTSTLLPQITAKRVFDYSKAADGLRQILWGLFTKVVIADNLSVFANDIFQNHSVYSGSTLLIGAGFYAIQIYADFSGYSNIAIGLGKLLGFSLMRNFAYPYFARDITEFWKRWHISLTTWFRDYLFLPLSVNIAGKIKNEKVLFIKAELFIYIIASLITWFLTGLWHGANYTFIIWGLIHGMFLIVYQWQRGPRKRFLKRHGLTNDNRVIVIAETVVTLSIVLIAWIFFRADSVKEATGYISGIFSATIFSVPEFPNMKICLIISILTILFIFIEWLGRNEQYAIESMATRLPLIKRWIIYYILVIVIFFFAGLGQKFIYFQF